MFSCSYLPSNIVNSVRVEPVCLHNAVSWLHQGSEELNCILSYLFQHSLVWIRRKPTHPQCIRKPLYNCNDASREILTCICLDIFCLYSDSLNVVWIK